MATTLTVLLPAVTRATQPLATAVNTGAVVPISDEHYALEQSDGTIWSPWGPTVGFPRTPTQNIRIAAGNSVVIARRLTLNAGIGLTLGADADLTIL